MVRVLAIEQVLQAVGEVSARVARGAGLRGKEWQVLAWLGERGQCTGRELAHLTCRRRQEIHRTLQGLSAEFLVERLSGDSRRTVLWQLTNDGYFKFSLIRDLSSDLDALIQAEFKADLPQLLESLRRLRDVMRSGRVTYTDLAFSPPPARFQRWNPDH